MNKYIEKIIHKENAPKIIIGFFLLIVFILIIFLTVSLIDFYNSKIKNNNKIELFYIFEPNTISYNYEISNANADISEQLLSYGISYGIDVSEWQGEIDWKKVANTGISFAMIRCGFREISGSKIKEDAMFRKNIEGASKAGLNVGIYFFGTAKNKEEALEEANFTINLIKDYNITYPIAYDIESFNDGRLKNVSYSTITDNILTFTETIGSYGYDTMVYSYKNAFSSMLDTGKLDGKLIWLAHFVDETDYKGNYHMWQYTSEGRVDGINTKVDLNVSYFKYVDDESQIVENPNYKSVPFVEFEKTDEEVITVSNATIRSSATLILPNRLGTLSYGTKLIRTGKSENFSKVLYNGRVVYIENKYLRITS